MTEPVAGLVAVILAAGKGTRFPGVASKVLVPLAGRPLILHVIDAVGPLAPERIFAIVHHSRQLVEASFRHLPVEPIEQGEPRGTGHAVLAAETRLGRTPCRLLVVNGDVPMVRPATLARLVARLDDPAVAGAVLTAILDEPGSYGRIIRSPSGGVQAIVEAKDATAAELAVREINVGVYALRLPETFDVLHHVGTANAQGEIYLTDAVRGLVATGRRVEAEVLSDPREGLGVNSAAELAALERIFFSPGFARNPDGA